MVCLLFVHDYAVCVSVQTTLLRLCLCLWCYFAGAFANLPCFLSPWRRYFREKVIFCFQVTVFKQQASRLAALNDRLIGIKVGDFW